MRIILAILLAFSSAANASYIDTFNVGLALNSPIRSYSTMSMPYCWPHMNEETKLMTWECDEKRHIQEWAVLMPQWMNTSWQGDAMRGWRVTVTAGGDVYQWEDCVIDAVPDRFDFNSILSADCAVMVLFRDSFED